MGIPGVKLNHSKARIAKAIANSKGYAINCMSELDCGDEWFYDKLKQYPDLKQQLADERSKRRKNLVYKSESVIEWTLDQKVEMPSIAQKSAFYILDNQAKDLGYNQKDDNDTKKVPNEQFIQQEQENIDLKYENMQLKNESKRKADSQL